MPVAIALLAVIIASEIPSPSLSNPVDYTTWFNDRFAVKEADNAAPLLTEAAALIEVDPDLMDTIRFSDGWPTEHNDKIRGWVRSSKRALQRLDTAAERRKCFFAAKRGTPLHEQELPFGELRTLAYCNVARIHLAAADGDTEAALDHLRTGLQLTRHLRDQPNLVSYLVGLSIGIQHYECAVQVSASPKIDAATFAKQFRRIDRSGGDLRNAMIGEHVMQFALAQQIGLEHKSIPLKNPQKLADYFAELKRLGKGPYEALAAAIKNEEALLTRYELQDLEHMAGMLRVYQLDRRYQTERAGTRAALAIRAYYASNGKWPATLKEGTKGESSRRVLDPFSKAPLVYRKTANGPLLYSVWSDQKDDGGTTAVENVDDPGDRVFLKP